MANDRAYDMRLIADIGGTNARLAMSESGRISAGSSRSYVNGEWESLYAVISDYITHAAPDNIEEVVVALAGPVHGDHAELTNHKWSVDTAELSKVTGAGQSRLLNDLTALGYAAPKLGQDQLELVRQGTISVGAVRQSLIVGMGTGFNVSPILQNQQHVICAAVEAGHISMPQNVALQIKENNLDARAFPTIESLFSGRGLTTFIHQFPQFSDLTGRVAIELYDDHEVKEAIDLYAALLGRLLQALSLAYMPSDGIYLAGSVARSLLGVASTPCMAALQEGASRLLPTDTPIWIISDDLAALTGCAELKI